MASRDLLYKIELYNGAIAIASKETRTAIIEFIENYDAVTEKWEKIKAEKQANNTRIKSVHI